MVSGRQLRGRLSTPTFVMWRFVAGARSFRFAPQSQAADANFLAFRLLQFLLVPCSSFAIETVKMLLSNVCFAIFSFAY